MTALCLRDTRADNMSFLVNHSIVAKSGARRVAFILHGALGSGQNFRGIARKLCERLPHYAFVLVDLRNHGASVPAPPPHTLEACARDLRTLRSYWVEERPEFEPVSCVIGHSFGGKVAIEYARLYPEELEQVWVLDSNPGPQTAGVDHEILTVIRAIRSVPEPINNRADVVAAIEARGLSGALARWMTTNLRREEDRYVWAFDLDAIEELLRDYFARDLWAYLESPKTRTELRLVVAEHSDRWAPLMKSRVQSLSSSTRVFYHMIANAGHWLHVDNPDALLALLADQLPKPGAP